VAAYGIYEFATTLDSAGGVGVTSAEWVRVAVFGLIAGITTWAVPNADPKKLPELPPAPRVVPIKGGQQMVPSAVRPDRLDYDDLS
jgi:hypothetical protein